VEYQPKDGTQIKVFDALEWLVAIYSHVSSREEQMVRYYTIALSVWTVAKMPMKMIEFPASWSRNCSIKLSGNTGRA